MVIFENVKVPVENLIGEENSGFQYIMSNFNHERLVICMSAIRNCRNCVDECMKFVHKWETFGKKLIDDAVIRNKLANMVRDDLIIN